MAKRAGGCTKQKNGYFRWYKGKTRYVCGPNVPADKVEDLWIEKKKIINGDERDHVRRVRLGEMNLRELLSRFFTAMKARVARGKPKPLEERTLYNYDKDLNEFGLVIGGDRLIGDIGPEDFQRYAAKVSHMKASGYDSKVAHVTRLFRCQFRALMDRETRPRPGETDATPGGIQAPSGRSPKGL